MQTGCKFFYVAFDLVAFIFINRSLDRREDLMKGDLPITFFQAKNKSQLYLKNS